MEKNIKKILKTLNFKNRNDRNEIKQKMNHQQNNQTSCTKLVLINLKLFEIRRVKGCESWLGQKQIEIVGKK